MPSAELLASGSSTLNDPMVHRPRRFRWIDRGQQLGRIFVSHGRYFRRASRTVATDRFMNTRSDERGKLGFVERFLLNERIGQRVQLGGMLLESSFGSI